MFVLVRAVTYATLFIGLVLLYLPGRFLAWSGLSPPAAMGISQVVGMIMGVIGSIVVLWCILAFAFFGKGTPAPFDPPRYLVVRGPYCYVRNPMYLGAGLALAGAASFYGSWSLLGYVGLFFLATHAFVRWYEEPTLRQSYGREYEEYCSRTRRWWPHI